MHQQPPEKRNPAGASGGASGSGSSGSKLNPLPKPSQEKVQATSTWRTTYKVHRYADKFPMMSDAELDAFAKDIKANGLKNEITVAPDGVLLDGRNRLEALERAGEHLHHWQKRTWAGDPVAYILSQNIHRRHLTKQERADAIVAAAKMAVENKAGHVGPVSDDGLTDAGKRLVGGIGKLVDEIARGGRGKKNPIKEKALAVNAALPKDQQVSERTIKRSLQDDEKRAAAAAKRKATLEANRKARREEFEARHGPMFGPKEDTSSWQRLAKVLVMLGSDHEGERQASADAANKILQPLGWQLVKAEEKRASTLPQDGRSEVPVDDRTLENCSREVEDVVNRALFGGRR
jgi:hypothetical protein